MIDRTRRVGLSVLAGILLSANGLFAGAIHTYAYTGANFTSATGPYTTSDFVSGTITLSPPLPADSALSLNSLNFLNYSFSDGV